MDLHLNSATLCQSTTLIESITYLIASFCDFELFLTCFLIGMLQSDRNQITIICRSNYNCDGQFISLHSGPALYSG